MGMAYSVVNVVEGKYFYPLGKPFIQLFVIHHMVGMSVWSVNGSPNYILIFRAGRIDRRDHGAI